MKQTTLTQPGAPGCFIPSISFILHIAGFWLFLLFYMDVSLGFVNTSIASCDGCHA